MNQHLKNLRTSAILATAFPLALMAAVSSCSISEAQESAGAVSDGVIPVVERPSLATQATTGLVVELPASPTAKRGVIDLAIGLDTSGSMDGLLDSARQSLWAIVNDLALIEPAPVLRVALLTFGNDNHLAEKGWVHLDVPLTSDLDELSERLFALSTDGGTEFVGRLVDTAVRDLNWSEDANALKLLVVTGNESADQDTVIRLSQASLAAMTNGVLVNSIYCGDPSDEHAPAWREVALLASGHFASIDKDNGMVVLATPFDDELASLTATVNSTYIPWGREGRSGQLKQQAQDKANFVLNSEAAVGRIMTKNTSLYVCRWDLVDAVTVNKMKLKDVERSMLPEILQKMDDEQLLAYVNSMRTTREAIKEKITRVGSARAAWLVEERVRLQTDDSKALDRVMRDAIRVQARAMGFRFKKVEARKPSGSMSLKEQKKMLQPMIGGQDC